MTTATQPAQRLFHPYSGLEGILRCSHCGTLYLTGSLVRSVAKRVRQMRQKSKRSTLPLWPGEADADREITRRRKHAEWHRKKGHCVLTEQGYVLTPLGRKTSLVLPKEEPERTTAADFGFTAEVA